MSINKIALSFALAGILGATSAVAEESGFFVGAQTLYGAWKAKVKGTASGTSLTANITNPATRSLSGSFYLSESRNSTGTHHGIMGGYKYFFIPQFGLRFYGLLEYRDYKGDFEVSKWHVDFSIDALYNFILKDSFDLGAFGGFNIAPMKYKENGRTLLSDFDFGLNLGVRAVVKKKHGIELYTRFGLSQHEVNVLDVEFESYEATGAEKIFQFAAYKTDIQLKLYQPYQIGIRYIYSF